VTGVLTGAGRLVNVPPLSAETNRHGRWRSASWSQLVLSAGQEPDPAKRKAINSEINDVILDLVPFTAFSRYPHSHISSAKVQNLDYNQVPG
jgi:hypothetical protein